MAGNRNLASVSSAKDLTRRERAERSSSGSTDRTDRTDSTESGEGSSRPAATRESTPVSGLPTIRAEVKESPLPIQFARDSVDLLADDNADDLNDIRQVAQVMHGEEGSYIEKEGEKQNGAAYLDWYLHYKHNAAPKAAVRHLIEKATPSERAKLRGELGRPDGRLGRSSGGVDPAKVDDAEVAAQRRANCWTRWTRVRSTTRPRPRRW